jgi:hypothetical protein
MPPARTPERQTLRPGFGSPANRLSGPVALRPYITVGLPFSARARDPGLKDRRRESPHYSIW